MLAVALKGLAARKLRASLIGLAIVLGVAMISGTYVLTDTINNGFNTIFQTSYKNADAVISGKAAFSNTNGNGAPNPTFPDTVLSKVRVLPDVAFAEGSVQSDTVKLVGEAEDWRPIGALIARVHLFAGVGSALVLCLAAGPLALVKTGDRIRLDVEARALELCVAPEELDRRRAWNKRRAR